MILTVTPNSALDRVFFIEEWTPGLPIRIDEMVTAAGGKGLDASVSLSCQGIPSVALTFLAGEIGRELEGVLTAYGIETAPIWVDGETRVAHVVAEQKHRRHTHLISGNLLITAAHMDAFLGELARRLESASWMVCGGSLPKGVGTSVYTKFVTLARAARVPSLIDTSALPIEPVLQARPTILKMNRQEFEAAFGVRIATAEALLREGRKIREASRLENLVITCGQEGLYALTGEGAYLAQAPAQIAVNAAGAGDAVSGALAHMLGADARWPEALRRAAAVSAASVLTKATAECRMADVDRLLPQVTVQKVG